MRYVQIRQRCVGELAVFRRDSVMGKNADAAEKAGQHHVTAESIAGAGKHPVIRYDAQPAPEREDVPGIFPEDRHRGLRPRYGITFASNGFDERGFATPVRAENGDVLVGAHAQAEIVERNLLSAHHAQVVEVQ